jgi:Mg-chelatase subunit ChlD
MPIKTLFWIILLTLAPPPAPPEPDPLPPAGSRAHERSVHEHLNGQAALLVEQHDRDGRYREVYADDHLNAFLNGARAEDDGVRPFNHFRHAITGEGPSWGASALNWAYDDLIGDLTWKAAIESYGESPQAKAAAYLRLGHVAHLMGDMSQPDHVHLEPHYHNPDAVIGPKEIGPRWEPWGERFITSGGGRFTLMNDPPVGAGSFQLDEFFTRMSTISYDKSSFGGVLYEDERRPADGEIAEMFDVSYEIVSEVAGIPVTRGWVVRNKAVVDPSRRIVAYSDGSPGTGGGVNNRGGLIVRDDLEGAGVFYDVCTEVTVRACFRAGVPSRFYIEDPVAAIPASYKSAPNVERRQLAYFYARELWPQAIRHIAGLYMHFHDVVNPPPYVRKVQIDQGGSRYQREWQLEFPPGSGIRQRVDAVPTRPVADDKPVEITVTFSERVTTPEVQIGRSRKLPLTAKAGSADTVWTLRLTPKQDLSPQDHDSSELTIRIWAKDAHRHVSGRTALGDALDARPATAAKATYRDRNQYGWAGYEDGPDENHTLKLGRPDIMLFLLDVSGSMAGARIEQARASGVRTVQTLKTNQDSAGARYKASVAVFGGGCETGAARTVLDFTDDLVRVEQTFRSGIPAPSGATPLHLARGEAEEMIERYRRANGGGRGEIVLLSDGMDTCESTRPAGTYSRAVGGGSPAGGVRYLTVGFDLAPGSPAERDLQYLASMSEGRYFNVKDQRQLTRAFEKLLKSYVPRPSAAAGGAPPAARAAFDSGSSALAARAYPEARRAFERYTAAMPQDPAGHYNLAQALEATDRYRGAAAAYRRYLAAAPQVPDRAAVQAMFPVLERDYADHFAYQLELIRSDLAYLENYYQRLFNQDNASLAAEFRGFVLEKGDFYANLSDVLEIEAPWVDAAERDVGQSVQRLARRVNSPTFDRDAVSLLAVPIGHLEELMRALSAHLP